MKTENSSKGWPEGWLVAAAAAVFAAVMARVIGDHGLFPTIMIAVFVFLVFGVLLGMFWGGPIATAHGSSAHDFSAHDHGASGKHSSASDHGAASSGDKVEPAIAPTALADMPVMVSPAAVATDDGMPLAPVDTAETGIAEEVAAKAIVVEDAAPTMATDQSVVAAPEAVATDDGMAQAPVAQALMTEPALIADAGTADRDSEDEADTEDTSTPRRATQGRVAASATKAPRQAAKAQAAAGDGRRSP